MVASEISFNGVKLGRSWRNTVQKTKPLFAAVGAYTSPPPLHTHMPQRRQSREGVGWDTHEGESLEHSHTSGPYGS